MTYGWLCGELIRRVDGRSIGRFFQDEFAEPLGLDIWIGLPEEQEYRVAVLERGAGFGSQPRDVLASEGHDEVAWSIWANPPRFATGELPANTRRWHAAEIPASSGIVAARSSARAFSCLADGGSIERTRILHPRTIELGRTCLARGEDPYIGEVSFGIGFELQTSELPFGPAESGFGHKGTGGSIQGAWPEHRTGFSYVTNELREGPGPDPRRGALLEALDRSIRRPGRTAVL